MSIGMLGRRLHGVPHVAIERGRVVDDRHRAAAEHVRRPHDDREADLRRDLARLFAATSPCRSAACGMPRSQQQLREALAILGQIDRVGRRAEILTPAACSGSASFSGVWPPNCTTHDDVAAAAPLARR